jgi:hypothetical protein
MEVGPNGGKMGEPSRNFIAWLSQPLRLLLELFSLTFLSLDILFWWCRFLLIWFVLDMFESWQSFRLPVDSEARNLRHSSLLTMTLFWGHRWIKKLRCHVKNRFPLTYLSLGSPIFWHLLASWDLLTFFSWRLLLSTSNSLGTFFFFDTFVFASFFYILFVWNLFLSKLLSLQTFCLVLRWFFTLMSFSWHLSLMASLFLKYVQVLLCTTKLAPNTPQYYFVLYKACTEHFSVLLCTTKLAQSTSQYYFVHSLCYEACRKHFPVRLCTTKFLHRTVSFDTPKLLDTENHRFFCTKFHVDNGNWDWSSKTGSRRQSENKAILEALFERNSKHD